MKNITLTIVFLSLVLTNVFAQKGPLKGSGRVMTKSYDFKEFDKLAIKDFDGVIEVEVGKPYAVTISIDDNLQSMLDVEYNFDVQKLSVSLDNNKNGRLYLENTNIKIKISLPNLTDLEHRGNTTLVINGIFGKSFKLNNNGNGDAFLAGEVDEIDIHKTGNGEVKANMLKCKTARVKSYGNGNVLVNAQVSLSAFGMGNCGILQFGRGKVDPLSGVIGNGSVRIM